MIEFRIINGPHKGLCYSPGKEPYENPAELTKWISDEGMRNSEEFNKDVRVSMKAFHDQFIKSDIRSISPIGASYLVDGCLINRVDFDKAMQKEINEYLLKD